LKLHLSDATGRNAITGYGAGYVEVNRERYEKSLVVMPTRLDLQWRVSSGAEIAADSIRPLAGLEVEIVLIGTGEHQRFPEPTALRPLVEAGIGFEIMSTPAACRTYNILVAEDRIVAAALIP
jgi:uncharacterized protein